MVLEKGLREILKLEIRTLVCQEVRLLRLRQVYPPEIVKAGMARSIEETKQEIVRLIRSVGPSKRNDLLRRMIEETVDEEIDKAIEVRKNRCFRCIHGRFYDRSETPYQNLPLEEHRAHAFGCDQPRPALSERCDRFAEVGTTSLEEYLEEIAFLYEFRELIERTEELWRDYFLK